MQPKVNAEPPTLGSLQEENRQLRERFYFLEGKHNTLNDAFVALRHAICLAAFMFSMPGSDAGNLTGFQREGTTGHHDHDVLTPETRQAWANVAALFPVFGPLLDKGEGARQPEEVRRGG